MHKLYLRSSLISPENGSQQKTQNTTVKTSSERNKETTSTVTDEFKEVQVRALPKKFSRKN